MQTRKRAKSITFGRKEKKEHEAIKEAPEKVADVDVVESTKTSEKAEVVERRPVADKPKVEELSPTLTEVKAEPEPEEDSKSEEKSDGEPTSDVATPASEFISDSPTDAKSAEQDTSAEKPFASPEASLSPVKEEEALKPIETVLQEPVPTTTPPPQTTSSQELSSTLPPSAFSVQTSDNEISSKPEVGKRRFGVYFFVVALLSFILGLGAMAAVSYFGLINLSLPKLSVPSNIQMPALLGAKPTPTSVPTPTAAPTAVTVNLGQYSIAVLNGSGVTGQAGKVKDSLTSAGFKVNSTGNADNNNFTKTEIATKKSVSQDYVSKLEDTLNKSFVVDTTVASLPDSSTTDVTVSLGSSTAK